jgi:hypothetical protein
MYDWFPIGGVAVTHPGLHSPAGHVASEDIPAPCHRVTPVG